MSLKLLPSSLELLSHVSTVTATITLSEMLSELWLLGSLRILKTSLPNDSSFSSLCSIKSLSKSVRPSGNLLGFLVLQRGVEVDKNKSKAIMKENPPKNKKELQRFIGQVNYLRRFISNLAGKTNEFLYLLKLKDRGQFKWESWHQKDFDVIKGYLSNQPVLIYATQVGFPVCGVGVKPCEFKFDRSSTETAAGAGIVITSSRGVKTDLSFNLGFPCTNNQAINHPSIQQRRIQVDTFNLDIKLAGDWRDAIKQMHRFPRGIGDHEEISRRSVRSTSIWSEDEIVDKKRHDNVQRILVDELHNAVKPRPLKGWAMNLIGKIYPSSSKGHSFNLVATDFFTKWVETVTLKKMEQGDVIKFVKENIIHKFGILESLTMEQRTIFMGSAMREFAEDYGIKLINSSSHYQQSNRQAEAANKVMIRILQKMMEENPRDWKRLVLKMLCAYRTSKRTATGNILSPEHYSEEMIIELEEVDELRIQAYNALLLQMQKVERIYNKRINKKSFQERDIVCKTILPLGKRTEIGQMVLELGRII
ncbi:uncharacterized protein LOC142556934 [Primulina tabacum]|uniref:uncharacterized protein LOC142556934 n=1 Tax=Primulina tabacum TaxID=48773 RepID=UPI003F594BCC